MSTLEDLHALVHEHAERLREYLTVLDGVVRENGTTDGLEDDPRIEEAFRVAGRVAKRLDEAVEAAYGEDITVPGPYDDDADFDAPLWRDATEWHHMAVEMDVAVRDGLDEAELQSAIEPHVERMIEDLGRQGWTVGFHHVVEVMEPLDEGDD